MLRRWAIGTVVCCLAATGLVGSIAPAGAASKRATSFVPTVDGTGSRDVTRALNRFIARVPDGSTIRFPRGARYRVEGTLRLTDRHDLTFEGNGATVFATTRGDHDRCQWVVTRGSHIVFRDLVVKGANPNGGMSEGAYKPAFEGQHGFRLEGVHGAHLTRVTVTDTFGDFVYVGRDDLTRSWSEDVTILRSSFARNGRQGIAITKGRRVLIAKNHITATRRATIDLEPGTSSQGADHVAVVNNDIGPGRLLFVASHGQGPVDNILIHGNRLRGHSLTVEVQSPAGHLRSNWIVSSNSSDQVTRGRAIRFIGVQGVNVHHNVQRAAAGDDRVVVLWDVCSASVHDNDFGAGTIRSIGKGCRGRRR